MDLLFKSLTFSYQGPVIIVPTKYYKTPTQVFRDLGISMVIWANHNMRASVKAIQETSAQIYKDQSLINVEPKVCIFIQLCRYRPNGLCIRISICHPAIADNYTFVLFYLNITLIYCYRVRSDLMKTREK